MFYEWTACVMLFSLLFFYFWTYFLSTKLPTVHLMSNFQYKNLTYPSFEPEPTADCGRSWCWTRNLVNLSRRWYHPDNKQSPLSGRFTWYLTISPQAHNKHNAKLFFKIHFNPYSYTYRSPKYPYPHRFLLAAFSLS